MTADWVRLPAVPSIELSEISSKEENGVKIRLYVSPHDVPLAVRGRQDSASGRFIIEFKYIDEEPQKTIDEGPVSIRLGEHSRRIFAILLNAKHSKAKNISLELSALVNQAIHNLDDVPDDASVKVNHRLAVGAIEKQKDMLLATFA